MQHEGVIYQDLKLHAVQVMSDLSDLDITEESTGGATLSYEAFE